MSLVLLLTSGLFLRVLLHFHEIDPGFAIEKRIYAQAYVSRPEFTIETGRQFYGQALDRIRALPRYRERGNNRSASLHPRYARLRLEAWS